MFYIICESWLDKMIMEGLWLELSLGVNYSLESLGQNDEFIDEILDYVKILEKVRVKVK